MPAEPLTWIDVITKRGNKICPRCSGNGMEPTHCVFRFKRDGCGYRGDAESCDKSELACKALGAFEFFGASPALRSCGLCDGMGYIPEDA